MNWFRRDADGPFTWPGFGENMRVLQWIVQPAQGQAYAIESPIGWMPATRTWCGRGWRTVERRGIPAANLIRIRFAPGRSRMEAAEFQAIYRQVLAVTPQAVQAYALTWAAPNGAGCLSITTAFAAGYDPTFCASPCALTRASPLFASDTERPYTDRRWRPTMALAGTIFEAVKALIDRGIAADHTPPPGTGYLVETSDQQRSVRVLSFGRVEAALGRAVRIEQVKVDALSDTPDVLFYFTGAVSVPQIQTNRFRPGAVADHLT